jgi:hypothetical protein
MLPGCVLKSVERSVVEEAVRRVSSVRETSTRMVVTRTL